jgi:peptidoglycan/LPS O-acetylase OafA/YrhL
MRVTLSEGLSGRHNALGLIRLLLAAAVIFSHGFPLSGRGEDPFFRWSLGQENLGGYAVIGFFAISGYLITKSGTRNDILQYMWARVLRIFPAFFLVIGVSAFIVGPLIWLSMGRGIGSYINFGPGGPIAYITTNWTLTIGQWGINDIFATTTPYGLQTGGSVFNGSLWTLGYEWFCYLLIGAMVLFGVLSKFRVIVPVLTLVLFGMQIARFAGTGFGSVVPWLGDPFTVNLTLIFMLGACLALYADKIVLDDRLGFFCLAIAVWTVFKGGFGTLGFPAFAYALLWLAARLPDGLKKIGSKNDYSYGLYLYGFLVEQVLAYLGWHHWGYVPYVLASLVISAACAWLSWHLVEKRALALKGRGPGLGLTYWAGRIIRRETKAA